LLVWWVMIVLLGVGHRSSALMVIALGGCLGPARLDGADMSSFD
jgi:hypothetical protein